MNDEVKKRRKTQNTKTKVFRYEINACWNGERRQNKPNDPMKKNIKHKHVRL